MSLKEQMLHLSHLTDCEWRALEKIIAFCKQVQAEYNVLRELQKKRLQYTAMLTDFCRKCMDDECEKRENCEIKKTFSILNGN